MQFDFLERIFVMNIFLEALPPITPTSKVKVFVDIDDTILDYSPAIFKWLYLKSDNFKAQFPTVIDFLKRTTFDIMPLLEPDLVNECRDYIYDGCYKEMSTTRATSYLSQVGIELFYTAVDPYLAYNVQFYFWSAGDSLHKRHLMQMYNFTYGTSIDTVTADVVLTDDNRYRHVNKCAYIAQMLSNDPSITDVIVVDDQLSNLEAVAQDIAILNTIPDRRSPVNHRAYWVRLPYFVEHGKPEMGELDEK